MRTLKLQTLFNRCKNLTAFAIVQALFIIIPVIILVFLYTFMAQGQIEDMFNNPLIVSQLLIVLALPFCYLAMKNIRSDLKNNYHESLIPLWLLAIYQISSFNLVCGFLMVYGMYQEYGKEMFAIKKFKSNKYAKGLLVGLIPLGLLYVLIVFVKIRLGIFL